MKFEQRIGELVCHLHSPIVTGPQSAVDALEYLPGGDRRLLPRGVRIWKLFAIQVRLVRVVSDMKKVPWHR
jgi:hypothetical protein